MRCLNIGILMLTILTIGCTTPQPGPTMSQQEATINENPFSIWDGCSREPKKLLETWKNFDATEAYFKKLKTDKLEVLRTNKGWEAVYLKYFAPYLLIEDIASEVAKTCWSHYEASLIEAKKGQWSAVQQSNKHWLSCLNYNYREVPVEVAMISKCIAGAASTAAE